MRPLLAITLAALCAVCACDDAAPAAEDAAPSTPGATAPAVTVKVGDDIVAATAKVAFTQGKVVKVAGDAVTFELGRPNRETGARATKTVTGADVYRLGAQTDSKPGDHLICHVIERKTYAIPLPTWHPCRVLSVSGGKVKVEDHYGTKYELDPDRTVRPREETQKAIATYIETEIKHRAFDRAFEAAGRPARPAGWQPTVEDAVVVHWVGSSWYGAKVIEVKKDKGKVRVDFEGDRWSDRDVAWTEVAPSPEAPAEVRVDQFVIVRPKAADERWEHNRVVAINGDSVEVINRNDVKKSVAREDLVPIVAVTKKGADPSD